MPQSPTRPAPVTGMAQFPQTQRELVGLAMRPGARRPSPSALPGTQRERVQRALQLGLGGSSQRPAGRARRSGIFR